MKFEDEWTNYGKAGTKEKLIFMQWAPGEPNNKHSREECIALGTVHTDKESYTNEWNDVPCNDEKAIKGYICSKKGSLKSSSHSA